MTHTPEEATLQAEILARVAALGAGLGPRLAGALTELTERLALADGYFLHPLAFPVLQLPGWAARAARVAPPEAVILDLAESAAVGYLHVRIQDDLLDEGVGRTPASVMLSDVLFARHQRLLVQAVGDHRSFWSLFQSRWADYGEAMLLERALHDGAAPCDSDAFQAVLRRSLPLMLPPAAALIRAGREDRVPDLDRYTLELARSHQLFTDLIDAERDLAAGNLTWVLRDAGGARGEDPALDRRTVRRRLYLEGGFDRVMARAEEALAAAELASDAAGLGPESARYLASRRGQMQRARTRVFQALFDALLGSSGAGNL